MVTGIKKHTAVLLFFAVTAGAYSQTLEAFWTLVFAGKNITAPVFWNGNIYTAGEDRALNCITSRGTFLWRRNTEEYASNLLSVSAAGIIYMITAKGNLEVYSSQGMPLWSYSLKKKPVFPVYTARDGRAFIIQNDNIICLTPTGKLKWSLPLSSTPISVPAETGSRDIVLILTSGDFMRISIFGSVVEQRRLKKNVTAIGEAPDGYILAASDGSIQYFKTGGGSEPVWQMNGAGGCKGIFYKNGKVLYVFENGRLLFKTLHTNELVWEQQTGGSFASGVRCHTIGNEFNLTAKGYGCLVTEGGKIKWEKTIPENRFYPIITENGLLIGITNEVLNAYRVETKLIRRGEKRTAPKAFYSIIKNDSTQNTKEFFPFFLEYATAAELLNIIKKDIDNGTVGEKEPRYAFQLKTIFQNTQRAAYFPHSFSSFDRAQAAELLGRLGSYEYRDILISEIHSSIDSDVGTGIIRGLGHLAYDPDGKTMDGLDLLMKKADHNDTGLMGAACDCLLQMIKFGDEETAKRAISSLFYVVNGPYSDIIRNYARQKVKNIVE